MYNLLSAKWANQQSLFFGKNYPEIQLKLIKDTKYVKRLYALLSIHVKTYRKQKAKSLKGLMRIWFFNSSKVWLEFKFFASLIEVWHQYMCLWAQSDTRSKGPKNILGLVLARIFIVDSQQNLTPVVNKLSTMCCVKFAANIKCSQRDVLTTAHCRSIHDAEFVTPYYTN